MKKSLIALAVLAAAGAASAQSSVSLYGLVDAYVGNVKDTITGVRPKSQTVVDTNGLNNSRWGLKGSEDLGNGLKANFVLEAGFETDTGAAGSLGSTFQRKSTVGLSGAFGSVELGRNYTAYDTLRAVTNNTADTNVAVTTDVWKNGIGYSNRASNSVRFDSAVYGGVSGSISYGFGENKDLDTTVNPAVVKLGNDSTDMLSLHVKYANGPLLVGYAHQNEMGDGTVTGPDKKFNLIAGSYDFGVAKLVAGYNTEKVTAGGDKDKEYQFGVQAPLGAAVTVFAGYANSETETSGGATVSERSGYDFAATYALSKRTTAYAGYKNVEIDSGAGKGNEIDAFAVGVRHTF